MNFAKYHLHPTEGEMLLIYSDLAANLGLQEPDHIWKLSKQFGLNTVDLIDQTNMPMSKR